MNAVSHVVAVSALIQEYASMVKLEKVVVKVLDWKMNFAMDM